MDGDGKLAPTPNLFKFSPRIFNIWIDLGGVILMQFLSSNLCKPAGANGKKRESWYLKSKNPNGKPRTPLSRGYNTRKK